MTSSAVANRLTARDLWILTLLYEHKVLTTDHLTLLAFSSMNAAQHRLLILHRMHVIDRFRPYRSNGRAPFHYTVGSIGIAILAAEYNLDPRKLTLARDRIHAAPQGLLLAHTVGVNGFFADLSTLRFNKNNTRLVDWWSERQCAREWGHDLRPDGYGVLEVDSVRYPFFLEYDRGTETQTRVAAKLHAYRNFGFGTVLFWFPTRRRERNFLRACRRMSIAFTTGNAQNGRPTAALWHTADTPEEGRLLQAVLPTQ